MPSSGYVADTFVANEQPTTAKWNELWGNDAAMNSGAGFNDSIIVNRHLATLAVAASNMKNGMVKQRQGGTTGDASWLTGGTSNTDTSAKDVFIQAGATGVVNAALAITFPVPFTQSPIVIAVPNTGTTVHSALEVRTPTTTGFTVAMWSVSGGNIVNSTTESCNWIAIGQ